jgi:hypothetical protein
VNAALCLRDMNVVTIVVAFSFGFEARGGLGGFGISINVAVDSDIGFGT